MRRNNLPWKGYAFPQKISQHSQVFHKKTRIHKSKFHNSWVSISKCHVFRPSLGMISVHTPCNFVSTWRESWVVPSWSPVHRTSTPFNLQLSTFPSQTCRMAMAMEVLTSSYQPESPLDFHLKAWPGPPCCSCHVAGCCRAHVHLSPPQKKRASALKLCPVS